MLLLLSVIACTSSKPLSPDTAAPPGDSVSSDSAPSTAPDEADPVFDPGVLHEVEITMGSADWEELRYQTRSIYEMLEGDCLSAPWESPYTEFEAHVTFDGEEIGTVGLRKKGLLGSASTERPSLRIDTDEYVEDQRYRGLEKIVLNNNNQDLTRVRTCLAHTFFADVGLVAPRCSLAHVTVNGEDLGVYDNTEAFDEDLIERVTGHEPVTLYEGRLSDFREGWLDSFEAKGEDDDLSDLHAVVEALEADDDEVLAALDAVVDLEDFYRFWAAEAIAGHWDGYTGNTNNFYVYQSSVDHRLHFIAAGPDAAFDSRHPFGSGQPVWVATAGALPNRLIQIPEAAERYAEVVGEILEEDWDADALVAQVATWEALMDDVMERGQRRDLADLVEVVEAKRSDIEEELGEDVEAAALRGNPCFVQAGTVNVDFSTYYESYPSADLYTVGEAETYYEIDGTVYTSLQDGVSVGPYDEGYLLWITISEIAEGVYLAPYVIFEEELLEDDASLVIDGRAVQAALLYSSPETGGQWTTAAYLGDGALTLTVASGEAGEVVSGSLDAFVLTSGG